MTSLIFGILLFFGIHSLSIFALDFRNRLAARNELAWKGIYAIVSLIGIVLIIQGYAEARLSTSLLYTPPIWLRHLVALLMLPVFILFLAPYFPGSISRVTKHPQLIAVKLWAMSHLLVNGSVADVTLFAPFLLWAIADRISIKRRAPRPVPSLPKYRFNDAIVTLLGLVLYAVFSVYLHRYLIGVSPFGR